MYNVLLNYAPERKQLLKLFISSTICHYFKNKRKDIYWCISVGQVGIKISFVLLVRESTVPEQKLIS